MRAGAPLVPDHGGGVESSGDEICRADSAGYLARSSANAPAADAVADLVLSLPACGLPRVLSSISGTKTEPGATKSRDGPVADSGRPDIGVGPADRDHAGTITGRTDRPGIIAGSRATTMTSCRYAQAIALP